jgi:hypothetical protein
MMRGVGVYGGNLAWLGSSPPSAPTPVPVERHPEGCVFCPAELLGLERDRNGDPLCQTCPHLRPASSQERRD